jgi:hypothetical protein
VTFPGEYEEEMPPTGLLDDETIEAIVAGDAVDARFDQLAAFAHQARKLRDEPLPPPSTALSTVFAGRGPTASVIHPRRLAAGFAKVAGLGAVAKIGLGSFAAAASVVGAGAAGVLPDDANDQVRGAIEVLTPVDFGDSDGDGGAEDPAHRGGDNRPAGAGDFGERVSSDATGESDGRPGVDGREVSEHAPGAANRPEDPGAQGRGRADGTPAAPHVPGDPGGPGGPNGPGPAGEPPGSTAPGSTAPGASASGTAAGPAGAPAGTAPPLPPGLDAVSQSHAGGGD